MSHSIVGNQHPNSGNYAPLEETTCMYSEPVSFSLPMEDNQQWRLLIDTAAWAETNCNYWSVEEAKVI